MVLEQGDLVSNGPEIAAAGAFFLMGGFREGAVAHNGPVKGENCLLVLERLKNFCWMMVHLIVFKGVYSGVSLFYAGGLEFLLIMRGECLK